MMKSNKKVTWLLTVLVLGTWGTVAHQLMNVVAATRPESANESTGQSAPLGRDRFVYKDTLRDPFYLVLKHPARRDTSRKALTPFHLPPFKLTGILAGGKKRTAMVEGKNGETYFLNVGDTLRGITLLRINANNVVYSYEKRRLEWTLPHDL